MAQKNNCTFSLMNTVKKGFKSIRQNNKHKQSQSLSPNIGYFSASYDSDSAASFIPSNPPTKALAASRDHSLPFNVPSLFIDNKPETNTHLKANQIEFNQSNQCLTIPINIDIESVYNAEFDKKYNRKVLGPLKSVQFPLFIECHLNDSNQNQSKEPKLINKRSGSFNRAMMKRTLLSYVGSIAFCARMHGNELFLTKTHTYSKQKTIKNNTRSTQKEPITHSIA